MTSFCFFESCSEVFGFIVWEELLLPPELSPSELLSPEPPLELPPPELPSLEPPLELLPLPPELSLPEDSLDFSEFCSLAVELRPPKIAVESEYGVERLL